MSFREKQLTHDKKGHCLHISQSFSPDNEWLVYDTRNNDTLIRSTGSIEIVNVKTGEIKEVYKTSNQTEYGPGVGAVTFSPVADTVLFIHGIRNADSRNPYSFTRRTGVAVDIHHPYQPVFMDARDITVPFTPGALRGGTHAHSWSADGQWISFTYNDYVIEQLAKTDTSVQDLRAVGVMVPGHPVTVESDNAGENNSGKMFAVAVTQVTEHPQPGSDEIDRAFDEGWIGNGYQKTDGSWQKRAIAFQGNVRDKNGKTKTEVFVVDLPDNLTVARPGLPLEGTASSRPNVPAGVVQRRITFTAHGIEGPRHWLRSTSDGKQIAFLAKDAKGIVQIYGVSPNGGAITQLTFNEFSVAGPFNFSPDNRYIAYPADNSIFITDLKTSRSERVTPKSTDDEKPVGGVVWSHDGKTLAYNRYVKSGNEQFLQIFVSKRL
ncbi:DUF3748 domain-containing protein [Pedobacter sp. BS3]|nr:DUF3748 domain-containing protein [Pedobacter sp. BS3]